MPEHNFFFPDESVPAEVLTRRYVRQAEASAHGFEGDDEEISFQIGNMVLMGQAERAWPVLVAAIEMVDDERTLDYLGAGDLENIVRDHGPAFIDRIEHQANTSWRFRRALKGVWAFESPVQTRVEAICAETP